MTTASRSTGSLGPALNLDHPMSLGIYDDYLPRPTCCRLLSRSGVPVQNEVIVGTELKSVERVTGRLTPGKVAVAGAISGLWMG